MSPHRICPSLLRIGLFDRNAGFAFYAEQRVFNRDFLGGAYASRIESAFGGALHYTVRTCAVEFFSRFYVGKRLCQRASFAFDAAEAFRSVADGYYACKAAAFDIVFAI